MPPEALYLAFDDLRDGEQGIYLTTSRDQGATWDEPRPLVAGEQEEVEYRNPVSAVDGAGRLGVAWYERPPRGEPGCWRIAFALSTDGGRSFLDRVVVSSRDFCAVPGRTDGAGRWPAGGDYFGLVPLGGGAFRVLWADSRTGTYQLRTADVKVEER